MRTELSAWIWLGLAGAITLSPATASAKKVICIDGHDDAESTDDRRFISNYEGYVRAKGIAPTDVVRITGTLTACLGFVASGDELVIIAHGYDDGDGFHWGGMDYGIFGTGFSCQNRTAVACDPNDPNHCIIPPGPNDYYGPCDVAAMPVPAQFNTLTNVTVEFGSCWSANDPDGGGASGPSIPLIERLINAMGGDGNMHVATGFIGKAKVLNKKLLTGGDEAAQAAADACLQQNRSWEEYPPSNSGQPVNQESKAQEIVNGCLGATGVMVTIPGQPPGMQPNQGGYLQPFDAGVTPPECAPPDAPSGCDNTRELPGCGLGGSESIGSNFSIPAIPQWGSVLIALLVMLFGTVRLQGSARLSRAQRYIRLRIPHPR